MIKIPHAAIGCERMPVCGVHWQCTAHVTVDGVALCVAGAHDCICGVARTDDPEVWLEFGFLYDRKLDWAGALEKIREDGRFGSPLTDKQISEAAESTKRLIQEVNGLIQRTKVEK